MNKTLLAVVAVSFASLLASPSLAHEGHVEAPGSESAAASTNAGPIELSEMAQRNLGVVLSEVELGSFETTLRVVGEIQADPQRSGAVSTRIAGRVSKLLAQEGERVRKDQPLVEIESLQLGNPPPRARYSAPLDGIVLDRHVILGDQVEPNGHLLEIADLTEVVAVGRVFESQIGEVAVGQRVRVQVPSYPERSFEGVVERLGGRLDPTDRSLRIYARVSNPDLLLRPHMRAALSVVTETLETALTLPRSAVLGESGQLYVFVQDEADTRRFERRDVVVGLENDRRIEIIDGVYLGERVVTQGNYALQYIAPVANGRDSADEAAASHEGAAPHGAEGHAHDAPAQVGGESSALRPKSSTWTWLAALGIVALIGVGAWTLVRRRSLPRVY